MTDRGGCRFCPAEVFWAWSTHGARSIVDAEPREEGNLVIDGHRPDGTPIVRTLRKRELALAPLIDEPRYVSHFATCPRADEVRRRADDAKRAKAARRP